MNKLKEIAGIILGRGRKNFDRKVLRLVFSGFILIFAIIGTISLFGMAATWTAISRNGEETGEKSAEFVEKLSVENAKKNLLELTENRAILMNQQFEDVKLDVQMMSNEVTKILQNPQNYVPRKLKIANYDTIYSGEAYVHLSPKLTETGVTSEIQREIELESNFADIALPLSEMYECVYLGSKNGYTVRVDKVTAKDKFATLSHENHKNTYDSRERIWYKLGEKITKPTFTEPYVAASTEEPCISCVMPYFDNFGFAGVVSVDANAKDIYQVIRDTMIGISGYCFIIDGNGKILYSTQDTENFDEVDEYDNSELLKVMEKMKNGEIGVEIVSIDFEKYYIAYAPMKSIGWSLGTTIKVEEVLRPSEEAKSQIISQMDDFKFSLAQVFAFFTIFSLIIIWLLAKIFYKIGANASKKISKPILELSDGVRDIASGNFDKKLEIHTGDEIEHLATCFNAMTDEIKNYMANLQKVTSENEKIATEIDVAKEIQISMIKNKIDFNRDEFEIYTTMYTAKEVGGGFCDFYLLDENHLIFTITDVSEKGVPAALFMMITKTIMRNVTQMMSGDDMAKIFTTANKQLCYNNETMMFATIFMGMLDLRSGEVIFVNAGHKLPLIYRQNEKKFVYFRTENRNMALGVVEDWEYKQESLKLNFGDIIFLYTDTVVELQDKNGEFFNQKRLETCLNEIKIENLTLKEILIAVKKSFEDYVGDEKMIDDITMADIMYRGVQNE